MALDNDAVTKIARLARLRLSAEETSAYAHQLSDILAFVEQMGVVDTDQIAPLAHPLDMKARLRSDVVSEANRRDEFQTIAPRVENGLYLVPKVIE